MPSGRSVDNFFANYHHGAGEDHKQERKEYKDYYTCRPNCNPENGGPPYFTVINFIIILICFFMLNVPESEAQTNLITSSLIYQPELARTQPWRYFTYSFLHADFMHMFSNMVIFLLVTPLLEMAHDSLRPLLVYVVGVILGSMLSGIVAPSTYLVGASGGCYALVLAHLANICVNGDIMNKKTLVLRLIVLTPLVGAAIMDGVNAYRRWTDKSFLAGESGSGGGVSYAAHVAGAFTGLFMGAFVLRNYTVEKWEKWVKIAFLTIFSVGAIAVVVLCAMNETIQGLAAGANLKD